MAGLVGQPWVSSVCLVRFYGRPRLGLVRFGSVWFVSRRVRVSDSLATVERCLALQCRSVSSRTLSDDGDGFFLPKVGWVKFGFVEGQALGLCWRWRLQDAITEKNGTSWTLLNLGW